MIAAIGLALAAAQAGSSTAFAGLGAASLMALTAGLLSKERALVAPALLAVTLLLQLRPAIRHESGGTRARMRATGLVAAHLGIALTYWFAWRPGVLGEAAPRLLPLGDSTATQ
ncbi:MAG: hypothetical protein JRG80_18830, partial [Deltaproteobacteria bacterium]|nr:hypothetical protein [Deltaproteobacteria bacterium]